MISAADPLLQLLVSKGVLTASEVNSLSVAPANELRERLLVLLKEKGILSAADLSVLNAKPAAISAGAVPAPIGGAALSSATGTAIAAVDPDPQHTGPPQTPAAPSGGIIPAVAPIRVLNIDPPKREGVIPTIAIGKNIHLQPYGFFKASVVYDSSSPYGNDFPLPSFIGNNNFNGPDQMAEFHVRDRMLRLGSSFEWLDISPNVIVTGKLEVDFEGNFTRANNVNISSIRNNQPRIRLGYGRLDWKATENTTVNFLAGQDWTLFASSTLPNLFETTGAGIGFGTLYTRQPQFRFGINHKFDKGFSLEPDVAVVLPAFGNLPAAVAVNANNGLNDQLGFGERQGADSGKPEIQARLVAQFQLDHAPGVAPAQIIVSGVRGERDVVVLASAVPAAFTAAFPAGARISSTRYAWTGEIQLPTRYATLVAKFYSGSDLRYYFEGQVYGPFNDTTGLTGTATALSIDGATTTVFGLRGGVPVIANSLPPRARGGFANIGLPLSRWAHANPAGRNAGWVLNLHYGYDQVLARDVRREGGGRMKGDLFAGTIQYKLNNFVTFIAEQSLYRTRAIPLTATGLFPSFAGRPMREVTDRRTEIGPVFTF
ncbi:MAG TPA: hypothetical protein VEU31_10210 [Candidatus Acidoferrales bacterium]|nr:hypothetical protein [Candidatus Acidoferrales bacterium]